MGRFTKEEYDLCYNGLNGAFNEFPYTDLAVLLRTKFGIELATIVSLFLNFPAIANSVISYMENRDLHYDFAVEAQKWRPRSPQLSALKALIGRSQRPEDVDPGLERFLDESKQHLDPVEWGARFGPLEFQVCCIEIGKVKGTGFLIGPDVVMTNYHVINEVHTGKIAPGNVVLRFDYKKGLDGRVNKGIEFRLTSGNSDTWLLDWSPKRGWESQAFAPDSLPTADELDYALLRVDKMPGETPVVDVREGTPHQRGWIKLPAGTAAPQPGDIHFIYQHPRGGPLKLNFDLVERVNTNQTRVAYKTNTEGGSSGSPCFDREWSLVALHHFGHPEQDYNQGIPLSAIKARWARNRSQLEQRGLKYLLDNEGLTKN